MLLVLGKAVNWVQKVVGDSAVLKEKTMDWSMGVCSVDTSGDETVELLVEHLGIDAVASKVATMAASMVAR